MSIEACSGCKFGPKSNKWPCIDCLEHDRSEPIVQIKKTNTYIEHEIVVDGKVIGTAEIEPNEKELSRLTIFEPYQNHGYGTRVIKSLIARYGIQTLWVRSDNERAIHVYEKCGFVRSKETMFQMIIKE